MNRSQDFIILKCKNKNLTLFEKKYNIYTELQVDKFLNKNFNI